MKVKCLANTGTAFKDYKMPIGYFETSQFGAVNIGKEYLVMGISISEGLLTYLIDDGGIPVFYPFQLFEVIENKIDADWYFKIYTLKDSYYPYREAIWGYYELCFDDTYLDKLLDGDENAKIIYFNRKMEVERKLSQDLDEN